MKRQFLYACFLIVFCVLAVTQYSCQKAYVAPPPGTSPYQFVGLYGGSGIGNGILSKNGNQLAYDSVIITLNNSGGIVIRDAKGYFKSLTATLNIDTFTIPKQTVAGDTTVYSGYGVESRSTSSLTIFLYIDTNVYSVTAQKIFNGDPSWFIGSYKGQFSARNQPITNDSVLIYYDDTNPDPRNNPNFTPLLKMVDKATSVSLDITIIDSFNFTIPSQSDTPVISKPPVTLLGSGITGGLVVGDSVHFTINQQEYNYTLLEGTFAGIKTR